MPRNTNTGCLWVAFFSLPPAVVYRFSPVIIRKKNNPFKKKKIIPAAHAWGGKLVEGVVGQETITGPFNTSDKSCWGKLKQWQWG